mgnify:CR=1 FL=1
MVISMIYTNTNFLHSPLTATEAIRIKLFLGLICFKYLDEVLQRALIK